MSSAFWKNFVNSHSQRFVIFLQTKQVLKDTTWTLKIKEEELNSIKGDMRKNYEKRLNELLSQLNEKEMALTDFRSENVALQEAEKNSLLRVSSAWFWLLILGSLKNERT